MASIFDSIVMPAPAPVCPECGGRADRHGAAPGAVVRPHDRQDQAMDPAVGNPCPGAGRTSIDPADYVEANLRMRQARREREGGQSVICKNSRSHGWSFVEDLWIDGYPWSRCRTCGEEWPGHMATQ